MLRGLLPLAVGIAVAGALSAVPAIHAQDAPAPTQHPADIRLGSCAALGDVVVPLSAVIVPPGDPQGQAGATPVEQSVTEIPMALNDLLASGHAIAVHPSPDQVGTPVACGEIGGAVSDDGTLAIGLTAANGSKTSGTAYFAPTPQESTTVTLLLIDERAGRRDGGGEAAKAPVSGEATDADTAATDNASGNGGPAPATAPAPEPAPATAGLDGVSTISASNADGKNAKPDRNRDKAKADRDANGNAGDATTTADTAGDQGKESKRDERESEGGARAGEDG